MRIETIHREDEKPVIVVTASRTEWYRVKGSRCLVQRQAVNDVATYLNNGTVAEMGKEFGVSPSTIQTIRRDLLGVADAIIIG